MSSNSPIHGSSSLSPITSNSPLQGSSSPSPIAATSPPSPDHVCSMSAEFHLSQPIQIEDANVGQKRKTSVVSRMDIACAIIAHEYPLSIVEQFWFKRYFENLQPLFKVPYRHTVKRDVMKIYEAQKVKSMVLLDKLDTSSLLLDGQLFHMRCCAHIPNLIVQDGLAMIVDGISKVRSSVVFLSATPKREQTFREAVRQLKISSTKKVVLNVTTRWNSTYHMLSVALIYKDVFNRFKAIGPLYTSVPTEND
ncbi:zinc finger BED domain-containing protein RICESLEEPER 2-like [Senna tora]|uniref:Zinc finger BED domain-containing protein RICESLEEPER 2-like n=1 Tax=Senna tora TaxID=362788 RepID=A0A834TJD1_9FABA|nr:zinc finger BED domain-containing protein RICESLEEPER 2-like [Senna tora]